MFYRDSFLKGCPIFTNRTSPQYRRENAHTIFKTYIKSYETFIAFRNGDAGQQTAYHNPGSRITSYTGNQLLPALYGYILP